MSSTYRNTSSQDRAQAAAYYALCDRARALGLPVSLDDDRAPRTIRGLRKQVRRAERRQA